MSAGGSPSSWRGLSTGVLAVDRELMVRIANEAAGQIMGVDLTQATGSSLSQLAAGQERFSQFVAALVVRFAAGREEWREQIDLDGGADRRVLMCACTPHRASRAPIAATSLCLMT